MQARVRTHYAWQPGFMSSSAQSADQRQTVPQTFICAERGFGNHAGCFSRPPSCGKDCKTAVQLLVQCRNVWRSEHKPHAVYLFAQTSHDSCICQHKCPLVAPPRALHGTDGYLEALLAAHTHTCTLHLCPCIVTFLNSLLCLCAFRTFVCFCAYCTVQAR